MAYTGHSLLNQQIISRTFMKLDTNMDHIRNVLDQILFVSLHLRYDHPIKFALAYTCLMNFACDLHIEMFGLNFCLK